MNLPDGWRRVRLSGGRLVHLVAPGATTTACGRYNVHGAHDVDGKSDCGGCGRAGLHAIRIAAAVAEGRLNPPHPVGPDLAPVVDLTAWRRRRGA